MLLTPEQQTQITEPEAEQKSLRVLVLCTGNSARSIMAEAVLNRVGAPWFTAYSAGSHPTGRVNPLALEQISTLYSEQPYVSSKSWHVFAGAQAPEIDIVLTVCGNAAAETCPNFAGDYVHIHWGFPDPAGCSNELSVEREAFRQVFTELTARVEELVARLAAGASREAILQTMRAYSKQPDV